MEVCIIFFTSEHLAVFEKAELISNMVLRSDVYYNYEKSLNALQTNQLMQDKINNFLKTKELYEQVEKYGKYHPDYKELSLKVRQDKREMEKDPLFLSFKDAENELQFLLNDISVKIGQAVSSFVKVPVGDLYFSSDSSCGGSCGTGGSCSCSK